MWRECGERDRRGFARSTGVDERERKEGSTCILKVVGCRESVTKEFDAFLCAPEISEGAGELENGTRMAMLVETGSQGFAIERLRFGFTPGEVECRCSFVDGRRVR